MIGVAVGLAAGGLQFWLLTKFIGSITSGQLSGAGIIFGLLQFLLPLGTLVAVGFLRSGDLLPAAIGIIAALLVGVAAKFVITARKTRGRRDNND